MHLFPSLLALPLLAFAACSPFPDVTYTEGTDSIVADDDSDVVPGSPVAPAADASAPADVNDASEPPPVTTPPDAGPPVVLTCDKDPCVGNACAMPGTCDRCKDACKGQTKKCCADVDGAGGLALSCIAENARCAGESP